MNEYHDTPVLPYRLALPILLAIIVVGWAFIWFTAGLLFTWWQS